MLTQSIFLLPLFSRKSTSKSGFNGTFFSTYPPPSLSLFLAIVEAAIAALATAAAAAAAVYV